MVWLTQRLANRFTKHYGASVIGAITYPALRYQADHTGNMAEVVWHIVIGCRQRGHVIENQCPGVA